MMNEYMRAIPRLLAACLLVFPAAGICARDSVPANMHGVNYSGDRFVYWLEDPLDSKNRGDGDGVAAYSAGGLTCCYALPRRWSAGLKVKVNAIVSLRKTPDAELSDVTESQLVEIPPYVDGKVGELWVLRGADGTLSVVSSDFPPDHAKWPGMVKGWPVPSLEFRRKRYDLFVQQAADRVELYESMIVKMRDDPDSSAAASWETSQKYDKDSLQGFTGPTDASYHLYLKSSYVRGLTKAKAELDKLQKGRP